MDKEEIKRKLKEMIIERLNLQVSLDQFEDDKPLFRNPEEEEEGEGLNLDSVEALEIVVGIEAVFDVEIEEGDYVNEFFSIDTLADFVEKLLKEQKGE